MEVDKNLQIKLDLYDEGVPETDYDLNRIIYDLDSQIDLLSSQADKFDYLVSIGSGLLCGILDILWVGDFNLARGRKIASDGVDNFVKKTAKMLGCKDDDLEKSVSFLEKKFPIPSDGNTPDLGGGLQHHLRDFAHHPTIVGLMFSLLTQFTGKSYGTDASGAFLIVDVTKASKAFIGNDVPTKILYGTIGWFFHLVSDMAGSSASAGLSGGTGIPGPLLSMAKELSALPMFKNMKYGEKSLSEFLSKLFNGTYFLKRDEAGKIIKESVQRLDFRGELGIGVELGRQAIPVVANECIVRSFYFIRRLAIEIREKNIRKLSDVKQIDWEKVKPWNNPTIARMLTIATGVFTTVDVGEAIITQKYWVSINYIGVGRFAVAIGQDISWCMKARNISKIKQMYEEIQRFTYMTVDDDIYERIGSSMDFDKFGLTIEQTEILYNLEYYKTLNDINNTKLPINSAKVKQLKQEWLDEWKSYMSEGFPSFVQDENAKLDWFEIDDLIQLIEKNSPQGTWFRLVLLEMMLFEPYYPLSIEKNKKGEDVPCKKYSMLRNAVFGYRKDTGDNYIDSFFSDDYYTKGYVRRLRKCYNSVLRELNEVLKMVITTLSITAVITVVTVATAGAFAAPIAVALVGSKFAGLSGAALASACLAYLGGGAVAIGGAGMLGGTIAIVGGGAILGVGVGASVGGAVGSVGLLGKRNTIMQSAKLIVSVREIFLNDEHDADYSNTVYEQYVQNIMDIEKGLVELKLKADVATGDEKKMLKREIKNAKDSVEAMKIARKNLIKFISSFEEGLSHLYDEEDVEVPFCPKCYAILEDQQGFDGNDGTWTCLKCGQLLYGDEINDEFEGVVWYCDNCNTVLNTQDAFDDSLGTWECTECGCNSVIAETEIIEIEVDVEAIQEIKDYLDDK